MKAALEISMYPLDQQYEGPILQFIECLHQYEGLEIHTNRMSTQIFGEYELVMEAIRKEMKKAFEAGTTTSFVMKLLNI